MTRDHREYVEPDRTATVRFRRGSPGVLHLAATSGETASRDSSDHGSTRALDSAEFALQMLQFPYRAVFGDRTLAGGAAWNRAHLLSRPSDFAVLAERRCPVRTIR